MAHKYSLLCMVAIAAAITVAGCFVSSVYPYYTERDLMKNDALVGKWISRSPADAKLAAEILEIMPGDTLSYILGQRDSSGLHTEMSLHLFRLQGHLFLDGAPAKRQSDYIPGHRLWRVIRLDTVLSVSEMSKSWLQEQSDRNPRLLPRVVIDGRSSKPKDADIALTATTAELQRFFLAHLVTPEAWSDTLTLRHP